MNRLPSNQYTILKVSAAICLDNYRASHRDFYLMRAMEYIAAALALHRIERS